MAAKYLTLLLLVIASSYGKSIDNLKLKQVLILSRHHVRAPLYLDKLTYMTGKEFPKWKVPSEHLTERGALLEGYMGVYISQWLKKEGLLPEGCPDADKIHIYANTLQRTKATARAFIGSAFADCNIKVHHLNQSETKMDNTFNPIIRNPSQDFQYRVIQEVEDKLENIDLTESYRLLDSLIDIKHSEICKKEGLCDLLKNKTEVQVELGKEILFNGPFQIGYTVADVLSLSFYDGHPLEEIADEQLDTPDKWKLMTQFLRTNMLRFNSTNAAKDIAGQTVSYIKKALSNNDKVFTYMTGHDSNLCSVSRALDVEDYERVNSNEEFPIGGKLVFQRWSNGNKDFFKLENIYQTWDQVRKAKKISSDNLPQRITLKLRACDVDENGFSSWSDFEKVLEEF